MRSERTIDKPIDLFTVVWDFIIVFFINSLKMLCNNEPKWAMVVIGDCLFNIG